ncbi:hypothetical protein HG531_012959 [Fusarium graminearum]|nr:hypothetical protein HG531_012959 [Fusarium graminearum]
MSTNLGMHVLESDADNHSTTAPEQTADRCSDKGAKGTPVVAVQTLLHKEKFSSLFGVAVVDTAKDKDGQDTTEAANNNLEAAPPVELLNEANNKDRDGGRRDEIGDEPDLKNRGGL